MPLCKAYGTRILASAAVYDGVRDRFVWRRIDRVVPVGTSEVHDIHELIAERSAPAREATARVPERLMARWDEALALYLAGEFSAARRAFDRLCAEFPDDKPSRVLAEHCAALACEAHPPNRDGVTRLMEK